MTTFADILETLKAQGEARIDQNAADSYYERDDVHTDVFRHLKPVVQDALWEAPIDQHWMEEMYAIAGDHIDREDLEGRIRAVIVEMVSAAAHETIDPHLESYADEVFSQDRVVPAFG